MKQYSVVLGVVPDAVTVKFIQPDNPLHANTQGNASCNDEDCILPQCTPRTNRHTHQRTHTCTLD